ncbi:hypothetical protein JCM8547_006732 [Rhodosporidiobolus lusitaniae]
MVNTTAKQAAEYALALAIPTIDLPHPIPTLSSDLWSRHSSFAGAPKRESELLDREQVTDYERLEVIKAALVCNSTLSLLAVQMHLKERILSAVAQAYSNRVNPYIRACVFEAWLCVLYEEYGAEALRSFVRALYKDLLPLTVEAVRPLMTSQPESSLPSRNIVGDLREWQMAKNLAHFRSVEFGPKKEDPNSAGGRWVVEVTVCDSSDPRAAASAWEWIEAA